MAKKIKVEKNVPIPERRHNLDDYPMDKMAVGDSFLLTNVKPIVGYSLVARANRLIPGTKWTARKVGGGIRIWRIA